MDLESNNLPKSQDGSRSNIRSLLELVGIISSYTALFGVIGAFLGWRAHSSYMLNFGLDINIQSLNVMALTMTAWVEIVLTLVLIAGAIISRVVIQQVLSRISIRTSISLFVLSLIITIAGVLFVGYRFLFVRVGDMGIYEWTTVYVAFIGVWWACLVISDFIFDGHPSTSNYVSQGKFYTFIRSLFASKLAHRILLAGFVVYFLLSFASFRGLTFAFRDKTPSSHLSVIDITTDMPVTGLVGAIINELSNGEKYEYDGLRVIKWDQNYIYCFRLEEVDASSGSMPVYIIPMSMVSSIRVTPWYDPANIQATIKP